MIKIGDIVSIINSNRWEGCIGEVISTTPDRATVKVFREFDIDGKTWREYAYVSFLLENIRLETDEDEDEYGATLKVYHIKKLLSNKMDLLNKPNVATKEMYRNMLLEINKIIRMGE